MSIDKFWVAMDITAISLALQLQKRILNYYCQQTISCPNLKKDTSQRRIISGKNIFERWVYDDQEYFVCKKPDFNPKSPVGKLARLFNYYKESKH